MTFRLAFGFLTLILIACTNGTKNKAANYSEIIEQIRSKLAPDQRVAIFDVFVKNDVLYGETNLPEVKRELTIAFENRLVDSINLLKASYGLVNVSVCNIRSEPKHSAELATQALMGTPIRVYKKNDSWYLVQTPDGYLGWLDQGAFIAVSDDEFRDWKKSKKIVVSKPFDLIYSQIDDSVLSDAIEGNILIADKRQGDHYLVRLPDERMGKIKIESVVSYGDFIRIKEPLLNNVIESAHSYMGRPYLWGGTSGKGVDCSGFTKTIFYLNGLELPRDASQQANTGIKVETDTTLQNLLPGDFIFFGRKAQNNEKEKVTHVAIYLGEGKIIHASDRVQIESLKRGDSDFASQRLETMIRAKRMLQNIGENGVRKLQDHPLYN